MTGTAVQQPRGAMTAHVEKCLYAPVLTAHCDQGFTQKIKRVVVAGVGDVIEVTNHLPGGGKYALLLGFQEIRVPIDPARKAEAFQIGGNLCGQIVMQRARCFHDPRGPAQTLLNGSIARAGVLPPPASSSTEPAAGSLRLALFWCCVGLFGPRTRHKPRKGAVAQGADPVLAQRDGLARFENR